MAKTKAEFEGATADDVASQDDPKVWVRVLKAGDGKISNGKHSPRGGDELYERDEKFETLKSIAVELEDRHFVEIIAAPKPPKEPKPEPEPTPPAPEPVSAN